MRRRRESIDPLSVLGLSPGATADQIDAARRELAKRAHPDVGGSVDAMQRINAAADEALRRLTTAVPAADGPAEPTPHPAAGPRQRFGRRDHPSFTIEALPAEAFEALLLVAGWLGDLIDDDPPYALEVALATPFAGWCRLDLVPDAGASTVSLIVAGEPGLPPPDLDGVRDAWIGGLNQLDWADLDGSRPRP
jgi:hypothetical protein